MIGNALTLLREELSSYMIAHGDPASVIIDNISRLGTDSGSELQEHIVISVVNIEQENTLKNGQNFVKNANSGQYQNLPIYLNLYILIAANFDAGVPPNNGYVLALKRLSLAIRFFQGKPVFTPHTSPVPLPPPLNDLANPEISSLKLTMEFFSMSLEQVNHLWGSLGGRQLPAALYKARVIALSENKILRAAPLIEVVEVKSVEKSKA